MFNRGSSGLSTGGEVCGVLEFFLELSGLVIQGGSGGAASVIADHITVARSSPGSSSRSCSSLANSSSCIVNNSEVEGSQALISWLVRFSKTEVFNFLLKGSMSRGLQFLLICHIWFLKGFQSFIVKSCRFSRCFNFLR